MKRHIPDFIDAFLVPVRENQVAQVLLFATLVCIAVDVVLGIAGAALRHEIKSSKMRLGLQHKLGEVGLLVAADIMDGIIEGGFDLGVAPVLISTASFIVLMELFSIMENCVKMSPTFVDAPIIGQVARLVCDAKGREYERPSLEGQQDAGEQGDTEGQQAIEGQTEQEE